MPIITTKTLTFFKLRNAVYNEFSNVSELFQGEFNLEANDLNNINENSNITK